MQQRVCMGSAEHDRLLVAAIHVGTNYSAYAYSFKHDYQADATKVSFNKAWFSGPGSLVTVKAPTFVLFNENKKFHRFGYQAENIYANLTEDNKHHKWYFFKRFKTRLHGQKITRDIEIDDCRGRKMKAIDVFGAVINYLKEDLLNLLKTMASGLENQDIHWILTVPAIWSDSAKQFIREAACMADIDHAQLTLVTEPEATSLFCQLIHKGHFLGSEGAKSDLARPGTKYMIIDTGGDTVDITVHERQADGGLSELYIVRVDDLGGQKVDEEFCALLIRLLGHSVYQRFIDENYVDYIDLQRELEMKKRHIRLDGRITIKLSDVIAETYQEETKKDVKEAIEGSLYSGKITWRGNKMRIDAQVFNDLFKPCTDKIVSHIKDLLKQPNVQGTNIFLMVGGFSESPMLQNAITKAFPHGKVIIPDDAGLTVLKGAVIFGHQSVSKYTYGINISPPFDPAKHPEDHRVFVGGINRCRDVFKKYIHKGEVVGVGEVRSSKHVQLKSNEREMLLKVYASTKMDPKFVDEDNTKYLGNVLVNLPDSNDKIMVEVNLMLGEKGLTVEAVELSQHTKYRAHFDNL